MRKARIPRLIKQATITGFRGSGCSVNVLREKSVTRKADALTAIHAKPLITRKI